MDLLTVDLNDLYLFAQVVERRSFTSAADALGLPKSSVSRRIARLESSLGVRLLQRTSRRLHLTDSGQVLHRHCSALVAEAAAAEASVRRLSIEPAGTVRVSLPMAIANVVLPRLLPIFLSAYPKVHLVVQATNRRVDLIEEGLDVVLRGVDTDLESSSLVKASLCATRWALVASPAYLAQHGAIESAQELSEADTLMYAPINETERVWHLLGDGDARLDVPFAKVRLQSDNLSILQGAAVDGMGIAELPLYMCIAELEAGTLCQVLPAWSPRAGNLAILFPSRRGLAPAVRSFVDFLKTQLPPLLAFDRHDSPSTAKRRTRAKRG